MLHLGNKEECDKQINSLLQVVHRNNAASKVNKTSAKSNQLDELQEQKDYQISLLNNQLEQLQSRLTEANNMYREKEKENNLLQNELIEARKQLNDISSKKNSIKLTIIIEMQ